MTPYLGRALTLTIAAIYSSACGGDVGGTSATAGSGGAAVVVTPSVDGGARSGGATNGGASSVLTLPFDPTAGCRNVSVTGCNRCCTSSVDQSGNELCGVSQASGDSLTYSSTPGPCGSDCPVCARCTVDIQKTIDDATSHPRPECDCPTVGDGIDPCMDSSGCECFCNKLMGAIISCPQSSQVACNNGNHCRAFFVISSGLYSPGDQLEALWLNDSTEAAYLVNCGNLAFERNDIGSITTLAQAAPCSADATGLLASNGGTLAWKVNVPSNVGAGQIWLHGTYYMGCDSNIPESGHCTTGPLDVYQIIDVKAQ